MSDEALLDLLISYMRDEYETPPVTDSASSDPVLTAFFSDMVLGQDKEHIHLIKYDSLKVLPLTSEYDPILDSTAYTRLFQRLAAISNHNFEATVLSEKTDDYGQTTIKCMIDTVVHELLATTPQIHNGDGSNIEFDINILREINSLLRNQSQGFYVHSSREEEFGIPEMDIPPSTYTHYFFIVFLEAAHRDSLNANKGLHLY